MKFWRIVAGAFVVEALVAASAAQSTLGPVPSLPSAPSATQAVNAATFRHGEAALDMLRHHLSAGW